MAGSTIESSETGGDIYGGSNKQSNFAENDIVGLSIIEASPQYVTKFNTLRMHLNITDHPIVRLINFGRDQIKKFISDSEVGIK